MKTHKKGKDMAIYVVKRGDTFFRIAARFGVSGDELTRLNPQIRNINLIRVGEEITVPDSATGQPEPLPLEPVASPTSTESGPMGITVEVIGRKIVEKATQFVNLSETHQNATWDNPDTVGEDPEGHALRRMMEECGWQAGWAYCAAFCEAMWRAAYRELGAPESLQRDIAQKLTPSVMGSFNNWGAERMTRMPLPGAIFFMQKSDTGFGHAGLVVKSTASLMATIEGNTMPDPTDAAMDREGDGVFRRTRSLDFTRKRGLWLRGCLNPIPF